jgi:MFS family permease
MAWQIYELTDSPLQVGLLGLARAIPQMGLLLIAGLLADAMNRRRLMMRTEIGLFAVSMTLGLLTLAGHASLGVFYIATMMLAFFNSLETPARQSILPNLVPREELAQALALHGTQRYVPIIAGPSLAGVVLAIFGPAACYIASSVRRSATDKDMASQEMRPS